MEKRRPWKALTLPAHLCESDDPLLKAKAFALQLLILADQAGGDDMLTEIASWIRGLDINELENVRKEYEESQKVAANVMPFIRSDLKTLLDQHNCGYRNNCMKNETPDAPLEMDGFLFEDLDEALESQGLKSDLVCECCKSDEIVEIPVKYDSVTVESMVNLFHVVLRDVQLQTICVILGQEGGLVYGSFLLTSAKKIMSFESNTKFLEIQKTIARNYSMESRFEGKFDLVQLQEKLKNLAESGCLIVYPSSIEPEDNFPILKELPRFLNSKGNLFSTDEFRIVGGSDKI